MRNSSPRLRRLAILTDVGIAQSVIETDEVQAAARTLGVDVAKLEIRRAEDIAPIFGTLKGGADATLYVCTGPLVNSNRMLINNLANGARLPTVHGSRPYVEAGGLVSYGPDITDMFRRAAETSTKFCAGQSRTTCRSSSRSSSNWSSTCKRPGHSASTCRRRCSPARTR